MSSIQDYKRRVNVSAKGAIIDSTKKMYSINLPNSPTYYEVNINQSFELVGVSITDDSDTVEQKNIVSLQQLNAGDVFEWQNNTWIVSHMDNMHDVYYSGKIRLCPSSLKWLNSDGIVKEAYFAFASNQMSNFGVQDGRIISLGNERRQIMVQANVDTRELKKDKRFIVDGRAWKCTAHDGLIQGIVKLTLEEDTINQSVDNVELRIANYYGSLANFSISILNGESFSMSASQTLQLQTEVRNNGIVVDKTVIYESSDESIATVSTTGLVTSIANGNITVTARIEDIPDVFDTATIAIELETVHNYSVELDSAPTITINQSKIFTAIVKDNLIVDPTQTVMWYLMNDDGISYVTDIAEMTMSSTTQCTLKGLKLGYCKLKVVLVGSNPEVSSTFRVQVKSLL